MNGIFAAGKYWIALGCALLMCNAPCSAAEETEDSASAIPVDVKVDAHGAHLSNNGPLFLKPGDALRISTTPDTSSFLNGLYAVDGEGKIFLPIIGKMRIDKLSEKTLLDTLKVLFINYLRYPTIQVRPLIRISLLGGFQRPGLYYIDRDFSLWDAMYLAGGPVREDGLRRAVWERDRKTLSKDIIPCFQSGESLRRLGFESGDQLWTPIKEKQSWWERTGRETVFGGVLPMIATASSLYLTYLTYRYLQNH